MPVVRDEVASVVDANSAQPDGDEGRQSTMDATQDTSSVVPRSPNAVACIAVTALAAVAASVAIGLAMYDVALRPSTTSHSKQEALNVSGIAGGVAVARWCSAPVAAVAAAFLIAMLPEAALRRVPSMFASYLDRLHRALPLHPKGERAAFHIGIAYNVLVGEGDVPRALALAARAAGRAVTEAELRSLPQRLPAALEVRNDVVGVFTFVNTIWLVAILGLMAMVGPFVDVVTKPLRDLLADLWTFALECLVMAYERAFPASEVLLYGAACYVFVESARYATRRAKQTYSTTGTMMGVSAVALFWMAWLHTASKNHRGHGDMELFQAVSWLFIGLFSFPAAVLDQSKLLGYMAVSSIAAALGFSAYSTVLCTALGFHSYASLMRAAIGCGTMFVVSILLRWFRVDTRWTRPLEEPLGVVGTVVYLLALSIYMGNSGSAWSHAFYVVNVVVMVAAGRVVGHSGAANVGTVFGALFVFTLFCEHQPLHRDARIVWYFSLFAMLYAVSLYLSRHPELIVSLYAPRRGSV